MNYSEVLTKVQDIINGIVDEKLNVDGEIVLKELEENKLSLGLSSLDMMDLIIQVEMEFDIEIEQEKYSDLYDVNSLINMILELIKNKENQKNQLKQIENELFDGDVFE